MILFNPIDHSYTEEDIKYLSVTTLIKKFEESRDWLEIANNYVAKGREETFIKLARKEKKDVSYFEELFKNVDVTGEVIRDYWLNKGLIASTGGTIIHNYFENLDKLNHPDIVVQKEKNGVKQSLDLENLKPGIYTELIVYSRKYRVSGQIDRLILYEDNSFDMEDYKTDKEIDFEPPTYYNRKRKTKEQSFYCHPISHIGECNWNKYQLQLSTYAFMLEGYGYKPRRLQINHVILKRNDDNTFVLENDIPKILDVKFYECAYLKSEVRAMLKTIKNG